MKAPREKTSIVLWLIAIVAIGVFIYMFFFSPSEKIATALVGLIGLLITYYVSYWQGRTNAEQSTKDRASEVAFGLTKMDYDLRMKSGRRQQFLAPVKVYRELYKALLVLHTTGDWPSSIEKLGLLSIFEAGNESMYEPQFEDK